MLAAFLAVMALSLALAAWSRRGHGHGDPRAFFTASGQFGAVLFFFLSVGETYSTATMLGFPGGVYARGEGFVLWFFGYILLAAPVIFFAGPWIWRAGSLYRSVTIADFFRDHFDSRALELAVAVTALVLLVPVGTIQFIGLRLVLAALAPGVAPVVLTAMAGTMTFAYVALSGLRAAAWVAVLKDVLMLGAIIIVGALAISGWSAPIGATAAVPAAVRAPDQPLFALSTIVLQAIGFAMIPQNWAFIFSARSPGSIRRAQVIAPLYMVMFPLLMAVAYYAQRHGIEPEHPDFVFIATAAALLPAWGVGLVMAAVALSGLVILSSVCLAIGPLVTRNIVGGLGGRAQQSWSKVVIAAFLLLSLASAEAPGQLMAGLNNLFYFGIVQTFPGLIAAMLLPRVPARAVIAGIVAGDALVIAIRWTGVSALGLNPGVPGLVLNAIVLAAVTLAAPRREGRSVLSLLRRQAA